MAIRHRGGDGESSGLRAAELDPRKRIGPQPGALRWTLTDCRRPPRLYRPVFSLVTKDRNACYSSQHSQPWLRMPVCLSLTASIAMEPSTPSAIAASRLLPPPRSKPTSHHLRLHTYASRRVSNTSGRWTQMPSGRRKTILSIGSQMTANGYTNSAEAVQQID
jgi:hypothetical protein